MTRPDGAVGNLPDPTAGRPVNQSLQYFIINRIGIYCSVMSYNLGINIMAIDHLRKI